MCIASAKVVETQDGRENLLESRRAFAEAGARFRRLGPEDRDRLNDRAREYQDEREVQVDEAKEAVQRERQRAIGDDAAQTQRCGVPNHLSHARLSLLELQHVADAYNTREIQRKTLADGADDFGSLPTAPSQREQQVITEAIGRLPAEPRPPLPWWCTQLCRARDQMRNVALVVGADSDEWWLFLYAKQQPMEIMFLRLQVPSYGPGDEDDAAAMGSHMHNDLREFCCLPPVVRDHSEANK